MTDVIVTQADRELIAALFMTRPDCVEEQRPAACRAAARHRQSAQANALANRGVRAFVDAVLHGDEVHRKWLLDAADAWVNGMPLPPVQLSANPRGADDALAVIEEALGALEEAETAFRYYHDLHAAKDTPEGRDKARINLDLAVRMNTTLTNLQAFMDRAKGDGK